METGRLGMSVMCAYAVAVDVGAVFVDEHSTTARTAVACWRVCSDEA